MREGYYDGEPAQKQKSSPERVSSNKNPTSAVSNSSFELVKKQVGTRRDAFDFQLRPVGRTHNYNPIFYLIRFKDIVSNHEHRQGNSNAILQRSIASLLPRFSESTIGLHWLVLKNYFWELFGGVEQIYSSRTTSEPGRSRSSQPCH